MNSEMTQAPGASSSTASAAAPQLARTTDSLTDGTYSTAWYKVDKRGLRRALVPTLKYLTEADVHTFAFSVAANAVLAFFPFLCLLMTLSLRYFHSASMYNGVLELVKASLPIEPNWMAGKLEAVARGHRHLEIVPLIMLLITSSGVFLPLEVAFNQAWGFRKNRSYLGNQGISLVLAFACGILAFGPVAVGAGKRELSIFLFGSRTFPSPGLELLSRIGLSIVATIASIAVFFLLYWLLPNGRIKPNWVLFPAIFAGILMFLGQYAYTAALPLLDFRSTYGDPMYKCVSLIFWDYLSGLLLLGGAKLAALTKPPEERVSDDSQVPVE